MSDEPKDPNITTVENCGSTTWSGLTVPGVTFDDLVWRTGPTKPPLRYSVPNKRVALEPFPAESRENKVVGGVLKVSLNAVQGLKVVFASGDFAEGCICYVRADRARNSVWAKPESVFEIDGKKFILAPEDEVLVVDWKEAK
jgi:hypothetical protein